MTSLQPILVLFLCQKNSARSQMAEAILRRLGGQRFVVQSAGMHASRIHPLTRTVMEEGGYDLKGHRSKSAQEFLGKATFAYVISVCDVSHHDCPRLFPGALKHLNWPFPDPTAITGSHDEQLRGFREVRDTIHERIVKWLDTLPAMDASSPSPPPLAH